MTINIRLRKGSAAVITESVIDRVFASREAGETINVDVHPGARAIVAEDGATAEELRDLLLDDTQAAAIVANRDKSG